MTTHLPFERLAPQEAQQRLKQDDTDAILLDVREPLEWRTDGVIPGATCIPMSQLTARIDELPAESPIIVYCAHGIRSVNVAMWLSQQGYALVSDIRGGLDAWERAGHPIERP